MMRHTLFKIAGIVFVFATLGMQLATAAPATRKPETSKAPAARKPETSKAPAARTAPTQSDDDHDHAHAKQTGVKERTLFYDMYFGSKKIGQMTQKEVMHADGKTVVTSSSHSTIRVFFRTLKNKMQSYLVFKKGKLHKFQIDTTQRNKRVIVSGHRTPKGLFVKRTEGSNTTQKVFPYHEFQATSSDLRMPIHKKGYRLKRKLLQLPQQKVVEQKILYKGKIQRKLMDKKITAVDVQAKGPRGTANLLFTPTGRMLEMSVRMSIFGSFIIRLRKVTGEPL